MTGRIHRGECWQDGQRRVACARVLMVSWSWSADRWSGDSRSMRATRANQQGRLGASACLICKQVPQPPLSVSQSCSWPVCARSTRLRLRYHISVFSSRTCPRNNTCPKTKITGVQPCLQMRQVQFNLPHTRPATPPHTSCKSLHQLHNVEFRSNMTSTEQARVAQW